MPTFTGPTQTGRAFAPPAPPAGTEPAAMALFRHYGALTEGRNVFIMTNGAVTETDPIDWSLVAHALWGAHVEPITDAEATLLTAAGYGAYIT